MKTKTKKILLTIFIIAAIVLVGILSFYPEGYIIQYMMDEEVQTELFYDINEYAKRIDDIQTLSRSGATVYVIDDTIEDYISRNADDGLFFEAALDTEKKATTNPIIETHLVYVTKDARAGDSKTKDGNEVVRGIDTLNKRCKKQNRIVCKPLFFFEDSSVTCDCFDSLTIENIPVDNENFKFRSGPDNNPLIILAASLFEYKTQKTRSNYVQGGNYTYRSEYVQSYFPIFKDKDFDGVRCYTDAFKQLWCFDDKLARVFILNRLWNIVKRLGSDGLSNNPRGGTSWNENKQAFAPLPLIQDEIYFNNEQDKFQLVFGDTVIPLARTSIEISILGLSWKLTKTNQKSKEITEYEIGSFPQ